MVSINKDELTYLRVLQISNDYNDMGAGFYCGKFSDDCPMIISLIEKGLIKLHRGSPRITNAGREFV